jgi:SPP1 family predicted phage head-tail adaptor
MSPFEMDKRVTLQRRSEGKDSSGALVDGWVNVVETGDGKIWAQITDMTGRQYLAAHATQNAVLTRIRIWKRPGVLAKMRVLHNDDVYDIEEVLRPDNRRLYLMCTRGINNG